MDPHPPPVVFHKNGASGALFTAFDGVDLVVARRCQVPVVLRGEVGHKGELAQVKPHPIQPPVPRDLGEGDQGGGGPADPYP